MPFFRIPDEILFPDPMLAEDSGLLGVGGDLSVERLSLAYQLGIFPWFNEDQPILWWSPDPRMVMRPSELHVGRSLGKRIRQRPYRITLDTHFEEVMRACSSAERPDQDGTWITEDMIQAYTALHREGHAHSVEAWQDDVLVGGLYGVAFGTFFAGESMFARASDASKIAYVHLIRQLERWGHELIDCQVHTDHLARFGAREIPRLEYLRLLRQAIQQPGRQGPWQFDANFVCRG